MGPRAATDKAESPNGHMTASLRPAPCTKPPKGLYRATSNEDCRLSATGTR